MATPPTALSTAPTTAVGTGSRARAEYRFGIVLLLLLAAFTFMAAAPTGTWSRPVTLLVQGATLIAALTAAGVARALVRSAVVVTVVAFVAIAATVPISGTELDGLFFSRPRCATDERMFRWATHRTVLGTGRQSG
jgi:hypothetical protein